jgi:putative iron-dependent peroxidase
MNTSKVVGDIFYGGSQRQLLFLRSKLKNSQHFSRLLAARQAYALQEFRRQLISLRNVRARQFESPTSSQERHFGRPVTTAARMSDKVQPQQVDAPLTRSATFLVLTIADTPDAAQTVRSTLAGIDGLAKNVVIRDPSSSFACTIGIGSEAWDRVTRLPRPAELHPFPAVKGKVHTAVSTPGDLLFHIRSERRDICFEFERQLMNLLGDAVEVVDETNGFRYFDLRDLLGFVDGTANPVGPAVPESVLVTAQDDPHGVDGSYIVVQKYVHNMKAWQSLSTEKQEAIIGRTKLDNIELDDAPSGKQQAHKSLATIEDEYGNEHDILRDNMPFGSPGSGEYGTYFIGYSRRLWVIERMLQRMFIGNPPGLHDKLLDYSTPLTGTTFFAPSSRVLASLDDSD